MSSPPWQKKCFWYLAASLFLLEFAIKVSPGYMGPWIRADFSLNYREVGLYSALFYMTYALAQVPSGLFISRYRIKNLFLLYLFLFASGVFLTAHTDSYPILCLARILMGLGSSMTFTTLLTLASHWFDEKDFSYYVGVTNLFGMLGPIFLGKACHRYVNQENWQDLFSLLGCALILFFFLFLILNVQTKRKATSLMTRDIFNKIFTTQTFWASLLIAITFVSSVALIPELWGSFYLESHHQVLPQRTSSLISLVYAGIAVGGPTFGLLSKRFALKNLIRLSLFFQAALLVLFTQMGSTFLGATLFFIGFFASSMLLTFTLVKNTFHQSVPIAIATFNMLLTLCVSMTQPLSGWIFDVQADSTFSGQMTYVLFLLSLLHLSLGLFLHRLLTPDHKRKSSS